MNSISEDILLRMIRKALSRGGDYADVFVERRKGLSIYLEDDKIERISTGTDSGVGVRVIHGDRTAYAYTNDLSRDSLLDVSESVSKAVSEKTVKNVDINLMKARPLVTFEIKNSPSEVDIRKKIGLINRANKTVRDAGSKIRQSSISYRETYQDICIITSEGRMTEDKRVYTLALVHVVASEGDVIQTGYESVGGLIGFELFYECPLEEVALKVAQRALMMLSSRRAPGGRMPVVISSEAGGTMIHEAIGHGLEADLVQQGLSVYAGKIGERIASSLITIIDDSTLPNKRGSFSFDDEGVDSQRTVLVERGILKGYMYDRFAAMREGLRPTGNGRRGSYRHRPIPRMTNTFIAPSKHSPSEIIRSVDRGFFVKKMGGGQVNTVTGEFVFEVSEGYLIENGAVGESVRGATLIGNGPAVLRSIDMVGNDLGFSIGTCGKDGQGVPVSDAMPTIRLSEMVVGGEVS
jgi:TldD protein